MLITLCYVYLWVRFQKCYTLVIRSTVQRLYGSRIGFTFCTVKPGSLQRFESNGEQSFNTQFSAALPEDTIFLRLGNKAIYFTEPQACDDFSKWNLLSGSSVVYSPKAGHVAFVIEASTEQGVKSVASNRKLLKWSDYCLPLACYPGQPYQAVAQTTLDNFGRLGVAFMEDRLQMDNGLVPEKIVSVLLRESALKALSESKKPEADKRVEFTPHDTAEQISYSQPPSHGGATEGEEQAIPEQAKSGQDSGEPTKDGHMEPHHLHLSSCHECLELESSTILSVKFASAENIPDLPDDYEGGGADADTDSFLGRAKRANPEGKPPNILVFTGGCREKFERVRPLLAECVDTDSYTLYPLQPQQVLGEPWMESALLLVLADEQPLTPQLHDCFLAYLQGGGRVLGLSSSFCPGGLSLVPSGALGNRVCSLSFTRADSSEVELSVLASGSVFVRPKGPQAVGQVELWGELHGDSVDGRHMAIVRVMLGECGGEAVLCQVRLETPPDSQEVGAPRDFDKLKISNPLRYEVLCEILSALGLSCGPREVPPSSPVYLLCTAQGSRSSFLEWLPTQLDGEGLLRSSRVPLKVVPRAKPPPELPEGTLALVTEPPEDVSEHFSLHTYSRHLRSSTLGHCLLFAETTPTTMDLLEGLMLQLPQEVGLIAVAARQTKGRGRGGNTWLSPLGCAMFTVHVRVPVSSRLGQRIPFLQHLVALATVEAVRALPGYEDIDLRVKWPNDIYYSNLMKLGGVLVNSTLMGSTFHLLVGCGLNVSNSNPTMCANDLVAQHNRQHGTALGPLSTAQLIGRSVSALEELIAAFQEGGPDAVLPLYYKRWLHSDTQVRLWSEDGPQAEVVGLDDNGFLQVRSEDQGVVSVQPDGNSFDMLKNLLVTKQH